MPGSEQLSELEKKTEPEKKQEWDQLQVIEKLENIKGSLVSTENQKAVDRFTDKLKKNIDKKGNTNKIEKKIIDQFNTNWHDILSNINDNLKEKIKDNNLLF